ncbi:MAG TPA: YCF48-related protein [Pyrinomonadaceae bacterium]
MKRQLAPLLILIALTVSAPDLAAQSGWTVRRIPSGGRDLNAVYFTDSKRGWVGGDEGFFAHTEDGGLSWVEQRIATHDAINDVYFVSKEKGFVLAGGAIFSTSDSGHTWQQAHTFSAADFHGAAPELYSLRFDGKKRGWVVGSVSRGDRVEDSILAITRDGGATWQVLQAPSRQELIHIDFIDDKQGWIVGAGGAILHTTDAGESWTRQESGTTVTLYHVDFRNKRQGLAVGERGTILETNDGGESWSKVTSTARATLLSVQFVSEDDGWAIGRSGTILRSGDGGRVWREQESGIKQNFYAMFMTKNNGWVVGNSGLMLMYEQ